MTLANGHPSANSQITHTIRELIDQIVNMALEHGPPSARLRDSWTDVTMIEIARILEVEDVLK